MSQVDYVISNASGAVVRADINASFEAIATNNAGPVAPTTTFPHMWWFDETNDLLKQRDASNTSWVTVARKDVDGWTPYLQGTALDELIGDNLLESNNTWAGTNEFDSTTTFDGTVNLNGAIVLSGSNTVNFADRELIRPKLKDYGETVNARGSISGAQDINLEDGNVVTATITGATTFTFSNPPATGIGGSFTLILTNGGSNVTWPASVTWPGGSPPSLSASGVDILVFFTVNAGTTWRGSLSGKGFA
jgi:hypothetical protein